MFTSPEAVSRSADYDARLRAALSADNRVASVDPTEDADGIINARTMRFLETDEDASIDEALNSFNAFRFESSVDLSCLCSNQESAKNRGMDDVPTAEYLAVWDGIVLAVQWDQPDTLVHGSGGHVVIDVLEDVVAAAGFELEVMACSPGCLHRFVHADFVTFATASPPEPLESGGDTPPGRSLIMPFGRAESDVENLRRSFYAMARLLQQYAISRNLETSILSVERIAHSDLVTLM